MRLLRILAMGMVALLFSWLAMKSYAHFRATGTFLSLGLLLVNALLVFFFLSRRSATTVATAPAAWLLSVVGTVLPLFLRPAEAESNLLVGLGAALQALGVALMITALGSLSRSFGIVPANRGIRSSGLYGYVRHPLYAAELVFFLGFALSNPSARNIALVAIEVGIQALRARREERFLTGDSAYQAYCGMVRYRFLPGLI